MEKAESNAAEAPLIIGNVTIAPGTRTTVDLPAARLYTHSQMNMPVHVVAGKRPGPRVFVSAAIHGDEINGVEIIRRLLHLPALRRLRGTLLAVPIVNIHGFIHRSRYLPDRRDLNRSFPGSHKGSLTARLAHLFMEEIVRNCTHGIDLHTGAVHRENLPQIRAWLDDAETRRLAEAFSVPVLLNSDLRDGSLREVAAELGIPMLLYEAGEALRFDEVSIRAGVKGIVSVLRALDMLPPSRSRQPPARPVLARDSTWVRAPQSGIMRTTTPLGAWVAKGDTLGVVADPFGEKEVPVPAAEDGIVIGRVTLPLVNEGEALYHIAGYGKTQRAEAVMERFHSEHEPTPETSGDEEPPIV